MFGTLFFQAAYVGLLALLTIAAISDFRQFIIPNWIPLSIAVFYGIFVVGLYLAGQPTPPWIAALILAFGITAASAILFSLGHLGGGDVKLLGAVSLWAGPDLVAEFLIVTALAGGAVALLYLIKVRAPTQASPKSEDNSMLSAKLGNPMPYGIAIALGGFFTVSQLINSVT